MATLIDASVFIAVERGMIDLDTVLAGHADEEIALAAITASEMLHGVHRAVQQDRLAKREAFVESLLAYLPVLPFDLVAARVHGRLWANLAARGISVGAHDLLVAATALAIGARVATQDQRSFPKIPGLSVVMW